MQLKMTLKSRFPLPSHRPKRLNIPLQAFWKSQFTDRQNLGRVGDERRQVLAEERAEALLFEELVQTCVAFAPDLRSHVSSALNTSGRAQTHMRAHTCKGPDEDRETSTQCHTPTHANNKRHRQRHSHRHSHRHTYLISTHRFKKLKMRADYLKRDFTSIERLDQLR
jgi:hypothetical protein